MTKRLRAAWYSRGFSFQKISSSKFNSCVLTRYEKIGRLDSVTWLHDLEKLSGAHCQKIPKCNSGARGTCPCKSVAVR